MRMYAKLAILALAVICLGALSLQRMKEAERRNFALVFNVSYPTNEPSRELAANAVIDRLAADKCSYNAYIADTSQLLSNINALQNESLRNPGDTNLLIAHDNARVKFKDDTDYVNARKSNFNDHAELASKAGFSDIAAAAGYPLQ